MFACCAPEVETAEEVTAMTTVKVVEGGQVKEVALKQAEKPMWQIEAEAQAKAAEERAEKAAEEKAAIEAAEAQKLKEASEAKDDQAKKAADQTAVREKVLKEKPGEKKTAGMVEEAIEQTADLSKTRYELEVTMASAKNLRDADWMPGGSDPYCRCEGIGRTKAKIETKVVDNKRDPVWNHTEKMVIGHDDSLKFTVYDKDVGDADDLLSDVELPFAKLMPSGFKGSLRLKHTNGDTAKAVVSDLEVEVKYLRSYTVKVVAKGKAKAKA
eukprot:TRINITY_DN14805_c0_g1_i1.p1 TRINITY_DN14805_c0_g1~~TRINITY_DN14805_c0_g1_i1.p1  ORF type:complete len:295 (+),score=105.79 TRINITY_DN14805_c0_g1_i1:76-885(+)